MCAWAFGDSFDLYTTVPADMTAGYWDSASGSAPALVTGRFSGGRGIQLIGTTLLVKSSGSNDVVHHIVVAFQQTAALSGTTIGSYVSFCDGATAQCSVVFRSDGAILLQSGGPTGSTLATYASAVTLQNQWFAFEIEVVINSATGSITVRKNGNTLNDFTLGSLNTRSTANNYANRINVGMSTTVNQQQIDDFLWRSDASSVPWVGDIRCYTRMPANNVQNQFASSPTALPQTPAVNNSSTTINAGQSRYMTFTASATGSINTVTAPIAVATTANLKCSLFSVSGGLPGTVLGSATPVAAPGVGNATFTFGTPVSVTAGTQYFAGFCGDTSSGQWGINSTTTGWFLSGTYAAFPANNPGVSSAAGAIAATIYISGVGNYPFVSESQQDGATSYVYDSTVNDADFYGIASIGVTPASVVAVTTRGFLQKSDAGSRSGAVQLKSGSTTVNSGSAVLSTTFAWMWRTDTTDPATGSAWTTTGVNNAQIGPTVTA